MRAIQFTEHGGPEMLTLVTDAPEPTAGPGQVRIIVRAAGVNPFDHKVRSGATGTTPLTEPVIPGLEAAGVVDQVGDGVSGVSVGDELFGLGSQTYADYAVLRSWAPKPAGLSFAEAAGLAVAGETAQRALAVLDLQPGQRLLVHGAAGGVGQAAVQLAREAGLLVVGTASERNHDLVRGLGAQPLTYGEGLPARVLALVHHGMDGIFDTAGTQMDDLLAMVDSPEHVVTIANYAARDVGVRFTAGGGNANDALARVAQLAGEGRYRVHVARTFELADAGAAQELSASRQAGGKLVLILS